MDLRIHGHHVEITDSIRGHIESAFDAALGQHERWIMEITVRLEDVNGPKGGVDKRCLAEIHVKPSGTVVLEEKQEDLYAAINVVADRAKQVVGRKIAKTREKPHA